MDSLPDDIAEFERILDRISEAEERITVAIRMIEWIYAQHPGLAHWALADEFPPEVSN